MEYLSKPIKARLTRCVAPSTGCAFGRDPTVTFDDTTRRSRAAALRLALIASVLLLAAGCQFDASGLSVPVLHDQYRGFCQCKICADWNYAAGQCVIPPGWIPDSTPKVVERCDEEEQVLLQDQQKVDNLISNLRADCHSNDTTTPYRICELVAVTDPNITVQPSPTPVPGYPLLSVKARDSCDPAWSLNSTQIALTTPQTTQYRLESSSWMELAYNGHYDVVGLQGQFFMEGIGCYDGSVHGHCPQILRSVDLWGTNDALLGGEYDLRDIVIAALGNVFGHVDNNGNNVASGTTEPEDLELAVQWGLATPGEPTGPLFITADQINHSNRRVGAKGTWGNTLFMSVDYNIRRYTVDGPLTLPNGGAGYMHLEGATDNHMPVADAGPDRQVCAEPGGIAYVPMNGRFLDPDYDDVYYKVGWYTSDWHKLAWGTLTPVLQLPVGIHDITLFVWDQDYGTGFDVVRVEVIQC